MMIFLKEIFMYFRKFSSLSLNYGFKCMRFKLNNKESYFFLIKSLFFATCWYFSI